VTAVSQPVDAARWLLRCPVDQAWIAPDIAECPDCGLSTGPLRALALVAANHLETAAEVSPGLAFTQVESASHLVPESESFLLDAGRVLAAAGAYEAARDALLRAAKIAPGRKDIQAELATVSAHIDPTAWLTAEPSRASATVPSAESAQAPASTALPSTPRAALMTDHVAARSRRDRADLGSSDYREACLEIARIEVAIAALALGTVTV
jgi:hypothetical protein